MKGCKDCPAFSKCIQTYRGSGCAALRGTYGLNSDPEIITNADRIRAMSDEKLAKYLSNPCDCAVDPERDGFRECGNDLCVKYLLEWLQQPAEE